MQKMGKLILVLFFVAFFMSTTSMIWAQSGGSLEGQVVDKNEKFPLPTVSIIIVGAKKHGSTDPDGRYFIENIPPGTYKVTFELPGYLKESVKNITITAGEGTELNAVLKMGFAHEMTVTARREIVSLQRVPQNVEVLTATELEETPVINVVQALNNITGVDVATGSGNTGPGTFISINGYEDVYIRKMVDGVDVGEVITNWSMLNAYPEELVSQIEVIKGGSSSIWGSNMGGIINLVTKRPRDLERPIISIKGIFSSFGEMDFENASTIPNSGSIKNYSANITGTQKDFYYMLGFNKDNHDGFIGLSSENNFSIFTKVGYNFNETTYLDFLYNYNRMKNKGLCFLETDMFKAWGIDYYWHYKDDSESTSQVGSLKFSTLVTPSMNIEAQLKFNKMYMDMTRENLEGTFDPPGSVSSFSLNDQKIGFTVKNSYNPSENFSLISGIDYYRIKADFSDYIADQPIIYVNEWAPFLNAEYRIGNFGLHAGARYDYNSSFGNQLSPSVGAVFNFLKASLIRVNVARTFRVPPLWYTLGESYMDAILPNPDLEPERAWAYSAGIESQELEFIWVKFSGYYHLMTDGIVQVSHPDQVGRFTWGNSDEFIRQGYEAELGVITPIGIIAYIGTNYNDHTNKGTGEIMSWIPTRTYKTGLKYINEKLDLAVNIRGRYIWWNEDEYLMSLFEPRDKVLMLDIRISKGFKISQFIQARLFLDVFNLTDQLYWDRKDCPNPRRWAQIGFEIKYK